MSQTKQKKKNSTRLWGRAKTQWGLGKRIQRTTNTTMKDTLSISKAIGRKRGCGEQKEIGKGTETGSRKKQKTQDESYNNQTISALQ